MRDNHQRQHAANGYSAAERPRRGKRKHAEHCANGDHDGALNEPASGLSHKKTSLKMAATGKRRERDIYLEGG